MWTMLCGSIPVRAFQLMHVNVRAGLVRTTGASDHPTVCPHKDINEGSPSCRRKMA